MDRKRWTSEILAILFEEQTVREEGLHCLIHLLFVYKAKKLPHKVHIT